MLDASNLRLCFLGLCIYDLLRRCVKNEIAAIDQTKILTLLAKASVVRMEILEELVVDCHKLVGKICY